MVEWENGRLVDLMKGRLKSEELESFSDQVSSIQWKLKMAGYHAYQAGMVTKMELGAVKAAMFLGVGKDPRLASMANLIAYAQSLHSITDVFSQIIYVCFEFKREEKKKSFYNVLKDLKDNRDRLPVEDVIGAIDKIVNSRDYQYISAFVNINKHRVVPLKSFCINEESNSAQFKVSEFKYG